MSELKEGINDIDNESYHAEREHVSSSGLKLLLKDPEAFHKHYVLNQKEDISNRSALDFGSYVHALILEPHVIDDEFAIYEGLQRRGDKYKTFASEHEGKIILTRSQADKAHRLFSAFSESAVTLDEGDVPLQSFFQDGWAEQCLCAELMGVKVKVKTDYRKEEASYASINDVKTSADYISTRADVERICSQWQYDLSAALYVDVAEKVTGRKHDFYFCFITKKPDAVVKCKIYKASEQMLQSGRDKYEQALMTLKLARETGSYYELKIQEIDAV